MLLEINFSVLRHVNTYTYGTYCRCVIILQGWIQAFGKCRGAQDSATDLTFNIVKVFKIQLNCRNYLLASMLQ